jgi:hypothetical protein
MAEIFDIVIAPPVNVEAELIRQVGLVLAIDSRRTSSLLLSAKIPIIVNQYETELEAEIIVEKLQTLGIKAFICIDSELRRLPSSFIRATSLRRDVNEFTFFSEVGLNLTISVADIFLFLLGTRSSIVTEKVTSSKMKFSLPATLLTGGLPVFRKVAQETLKNTTQNERFVRIYTLNSSDPIVEILQQEFNYSFLREKISVSSRINLNATIAELKAFSPRAIYDDKLDNNMGSNEQTEMNCRLIYFSYHFAQQKS